MSDHDDNSPIYILITTPQGGTRMTSAFIAQCWADAGRNVKLYSVLPGLFPPIDHDRIDVKAMMEEVYDQPESASRFVKIWRCLVLLIMLFRREAPKKILVIGMPLSVPIVIVNMLFFWRKAAEISVLVDTHATANRQYKKRRKNSLAFRLMSCVTHSPFFYRLVMQRATSVIALIDDMGQDMIATYGLDPQKLFVIPPIIDKAYFELDLPQQRPRNRILFLGRLSAQKNVGGLIRAFHRLNQRNREAKLLLVGDGEEREDLQKLTNRLGLEKQVEFCGLQSNVQGYLERASCLALSSHYEGFPLVILEACASGVPVVAYDCPSGPAATIDYGVNGYVVPHYDVDALADALRETLEGEWNPEIIRQSVMMYHPDKTKAKYEGFLESVEW